LVHDGYSVIAHAKSSDDGNTWVYGGVVLRETFGVSFPFVFWYDDHAYMLPETSQARNLRLYTTTREHFPYRWHVARELLCCERYVDSCIIQHNGLWWIFTTLASRQADMLLFYSDSLFGPFKPHPQNPVTRMAPARARNGGRPILDGDGRLLRFAQDSTRDSDQSLYAIHVHTLTPTEYGESEVWDRRLLAGAVFTSKMDDLDSGGRAGPHRMHHVDFHRLRNGKWMAVADVE